LLFVEWFSNISQKEASKEIYKIFQKYSGMNKKNQNLIKFLVEYGVVDKYFLESENDDVIKYWFIPAMISQDQKFSMEYYFDYVERLNSAIYDYTFSKVKSRFLSNQDKTINTPRISGGEIIAMGYSGKSVGILLKLIPITQLFAKQNHTLPETLAPFLRLQDREFGNFTSFILWGLIDEKLPKKYHLQLRDLLYDIQFLCNNKKLKLILSTNETELEMLLQNLAKVETVVHSHKFEPELFFDRVSISYNHSILNICILNQEERKIISDQKNSIDVVLMWPSLSSQ